MASETGYLKSLKTESIVQRVINCLTEAMVTKQLKPGDKIPPEPELAATLGVARTSVREATKIWHTWAFWKANVPKVPLSQPVSGKA